MYFLVGSYSDSPIIYLLGSMEKRITCNFFPVIFHSCHLNMYPSSRKEKKIVSQVYFGTFWQFVCELGKARQVSDEECFSCPLQFCTVNFFACSLHKPRFGFVYSLNSCSSSSSSNVQQQHGISPTSSDKKIGLLL